MIPPLNLFGEARVVKANKMEKLIKKYHRFLLGGEEVEVVCRKCEKARRRYTYVFTKKRLLCIDRKGLIFAKIEHTSIPYMGIAKFILTTETRYPNTTLSIWIRGERDPIMLNFFRRTDAYTLHDLLARHVLR